MKSVAVYAPQDENSPHLKAADEAIKLPMDKSPIAPYLNINALTDAAKETGATFVHPGYGFLY